MCHSLRFKTIENQIVEVDTPYIASGNSFILAILLPYPSQQEPKKVGVKIKCAIYPHFILHVQHKIWSVCAVGRLEKGCVCGEANMVI